jgi:hypothetical protein
LLLQLHAIQRVFHHLYHLAIDTESVATDSEDVKNLAILNKLAIELKDSTNTLFQLVLDFSLPNATHFAVCHTIYLLLRSFQPTTMNMGDVNMVWSHELLLHLMLAVFTLDISNLPYKAVFGVSNILNIMLKLLKDAFEEPKLKVCAAELFCRFLQEGAPLFVPFRSFLDSLLSCNKPSSFQLLAPLLFDMAKKSSKIPYLLSITIPTPVFLPALIEEIPTEHIRDPFTARKVISLLKLDFENSLSSGKFGGNFQKFFVCASRAVPLLFVPISMRSSGNARYTSIRLISRQYKEESSQEKEKVVGPEMDALRRSLILYTLTICGSLLSTTNEAHPSVSSQMLLLAQTLAGRGLFSVNPTTSFFRLFGDHDQHLVQALYWLQVLLTCGHRHFYPHQRSHSTDMPSSSGLLALLKAKIPQLPFFLNVLNPYSLFVAFLDFLKYDHSIMMDFMLSSETEWFLRYLLDFVKFCLADWNRTFVALYSLKRKQTANKSKEKTLLSEDVDALLEMLLQKQMNELSLDIDSESAIRASSSMDDDITNKSSTSISTEALDTLLQTSSEEQNEFDAVISTLIRLLFHLENAAKRGLIGYNVEPLLLRLRELEALYEKSETECPP